MRADAGRRIGVVGRAGLFGVEPLPDTWREALFVWPEGVSRITGKELAEAVAREAPVRFVSDSEMRDFYAHEFLDHVPEGNEDMTMLPQVLADAGFVVEYKPSFVLLYKKR